MADSTPHTSRGGHLPLEGITVLEIGSRIAAAFSASILAEQGARVIKVEDPHGGDVMRTVNPISGDQSLFFAVEDRNRVGVTLNLRHPTGQQMFRDLANHADVLCENFRPGTMERWGLGPKDLNPSLIYARISVFGQNGPYAQRPGVDLMGIAYGGLLHQTGPADQPPLKSSITVSDHLTAIFVAQAVSAALYRRRLDGGTPGKVIDASLYGSILRMVETTVAEFEATGVAPVRGRPRPVDGAPAGLFCTKDDMWIAVSAGSNAAFKKCASLVERTDWLQDPEFDTYEGRYANAESLNLGLRTWVASKDSSEVLERCRAYGIPVSPVNSAMDLIQDPHATARHDLPHVPDHVLGSMRQPAAYPRFTHHSAPLEGAPTLGEHNVEVWGEFLGLTRDELEVLRTDGVI